MAGQRLFVFYMRAPQVVGVIFAEGIYYRRKADVFFLEIANSLGERTRQALHVCDLLNFETMRVSAGTLSYVFSALSIQFLLTRTVTFCYNSVLASMCGRSKLRVEEKKR